MRALLLGLLAVQVLAACPATLMIGEEDAGVRDAGRSDAGTVSDAGSADSGTEFDAGRVFTACDLAATVKGSAGCRFYVVVPNDGDGCLAAFVNNTGIGSIRTSVVWKGNTLDGSRFTYLASSDGGVDAGTTYALAPSTGIPAGQTGIVFLHKSPTAPHPCPPGVNAAVENENVGGRRTGYADTLELRTSEPAIVYDIYPYGQGANPDGRASASLLLPTHVWDTNYVAVTLGHVNDAGAFVTPPIQPYTYPGIVIVAQEDGTRVTLRSTATTAIDVVDGGPSTTAGTTSTFSLNRGQSVRLTGGYNGTRAIQDFAGSAILSNLPVGVWAMNYTAYVFTDPPGWTVIGMVDGTQLTFEPSVPGAPATLQRSQRVDFVGAPAFRVRSQDAAHPFYVLGHRPSRFGTFAGLVTSNNELAHRQLTPTRALGSDYVAVANEASRYELGGPETFNVVPVDQFPQSAQVFADPTYAFTELTLARTRPLDGGAFQDVVLDCLGPVSGWQTAGAHQYARVQLKADGGGVGACDTGLRTLRSEAPFGVTVWGYAPWTSYAYPGGSNFNVINTVEVQ